MVDGIWPGDAVMQLWDSRVMGIGNGALNPAPVSSSCLYVHKTSRGCAGEAAGYALMW